MYMQESSRNVEHVCLIVKSYNRQTLLGHLYKYTMGTEYEYVDQYSESDRVASMVSPQHLTCAGTRLTPAN